MTPLDVSDEEFLRRIYELGPGATLYRISTFEIRDFPMPHTFWEKRLKALVKRGLVHAHQQDACWTGAHWYEPTAEGRALAGLPVERNGVDRTLIEPPPPSGRRARRHVSESNAPEEGWEVRPKGGP